MLDIKERDEEIINSLLLYLKKMGGGANLLVDDNTNKLTEVIARVRDRGNNTKRNRSRSIGDRAMKEAKALTITTADRQKENPSRSNGGSDHAISVICVPPGSKKGIRSVIYVHSTRAAQGFRKDDLPLVNHLGDPADLAIENILLREKIRRSEKELEKARGEIETKVEERTSELMEANRELNELSITDGLTRLFNHRYFLRELEAEYKRAIRYRRSLALLLLDIDHFKEVNDRYGHPCGDLVLKNLAGLLKGCLRNADVAARCGGDELAIILPETNKSKASEVADKLRRQLEKSPFEWDGNSFNITCSIGVAAVPDTGIDNWHSLLESADKSLYRAKGEGRNHVIAFNAHKM